MKLEFLNDDSKPKKLLTKAQRDALSKRSSEAVQRRKASGKFSYSEAGWSAHHADKRHRRNQGANVYVAIEHLKRVKK